MPINLPSHTEPEAMEWELVLPGVMDLCLMRSSHLTLSLVACQSRLLKAVAQQNFLLL